MSNKDKNNKIIDKINDLYILNRWKYLVLHSDGTYYTKQYYKNNKENKDKPLTDYIVSRHLCEKQTLGVFAGKINNIEVSKFICFDIDIPNIENAKWVSYKIINTLEEEGFNKYYISFSGNKGYHIEMFFTEPVEVRKLHSFYLYILNRSETLNLQQYNIEGQVEFRPTYQQGVKIPLGINFRNKELNNKCWFVDWTKSMKPVENYNYVLSIEKMDSILFCLKLDELIDINNLEQNKENIKSYEYIQKQYTPLKSYQLNVNEELTIEAIQKLEQQGLIMPCTRHDSLLKLGKYYKHLGLELSECKQSLIDWMSWQDKKYYNSSVEKVLEDIDKIIEYIYTNDCKIVSKARGISVSYEEIKEVLKAKTKNEKLTLYAFLIHSKRYATVTGQFYFPISSIMNTTHLSKPTVVTMTNKLEEQGFLSILSRNQIIKCNNNYITKAPNKYKMNLSVSKQNTDNKFVVLNTEEDYYKSFNNCILTYFSKKEIKKICGQRHYEELMKYQSIA